MSPKKDKKPDKENEKPLEQNAAEINKSEQADAFGFAGATESMNVESVSDASASVEGVFAEVNEKWGWVDPETGQKMALVKKASESRGLATLRLSSGLFDLDRALHGGWGIGRIHKLFGNKSCGKTMACLKTVATSKHYCRYCKVHMWRKVGTTGVNWRTGEVMSQNKTYMWAFDALMNENKDFREHVLKASKDRKLKLESGVHWLNLITREAVTAEDLKRHVAPDLWAEVAEWLNGGAEAGWPGLHAMMARLRNVPGSDGAHAEKHVGSWVPIKGWYGILGTAKKDSPAKVMAITGLFDCIEFRESLPCDFDTLVSTSPWASWMRGTPESETIRNDEEGKEIKLVIPAVPGRPEQLGLFLLRDKQDAGLDCKCHRAKPMQTVWFDTEGVYDNAWAESLGVDNSLVYVCRTEYAEQGIDIINALIKTQGVDLVVIDSIAQMTPKAELEGSAEDNTVGLLARKINSALRKWVSGQNMTGIDSLMKPTILLINQIREKVGVMFGNPETQPGGRGQEFATSSDVRMMAMKYEKQGDRVVRHDGDFEVQKNKCGPNRIGGSFQLWVDDDSSGEAMKGDTNDVDQCFNYAKSLTLVDCSKPGKVVINGKSYGTQEAAKTALKNDPDAYWRLREQTLARLCGGLPPNSTVLANPKG